ncbi:MAG: dTMP kinase [Verrucomicrobiota bacterium]
MNIPRTKGHLVVIEGIDGAGKSTVIQQLSRYCLEQQIPCVTSREPTTGKWGRLLRESARTGRLSLSQELELFMQDRAEHILTLIGPALAEGKVVLLDRYYFSTAAYQGARGADPEAILAQNEEFAPQPDLVLLLDLDPLAGRARIAARGDTPDDFEEAEALSQVRRIFLAIQRPYIVRIDAARSAEEVASQALEQMKRLLATSR